jgi:tetratricopeptide (TPR) repeat protein
MFMATNRAFMTMAILAVLLSMRPALLPAQQVDPGNQALKERALSRFSEGAYTIALSDFRMLMKDYPRDPLYRYYSGVCLVEMGRDLEDAVDLLFFASSRSVPEDVFFYLGEAYRKMYDFENAKKFYLEFDRKAPRSMTRERDSKLLIRSIDEARILTSSYNPFEVLAVTFMNLNEPKEYEQIVMKGGTLTTKPDALFSEGEDREALTGRMFLPEKVGRGEYVYFSGYQRSGRDGSQIFRARRSPTGKWTDIEVLEELCSERDEILPYFDPVGKDIYFASNGREGIGGFDLYSAHYDEERDEWSTPVNLGFPINSAYDDYLLLPGSDLGQVAFFSGRQVMDHSVAVYRVHLSEPKVSLASESPRRLQQIANLNGVAAEAMDEIESYQAMASIEQAVPETETVSQPPVDQPTAPVPEVDREYQSLVTNALAHQVTADSLTELATSARVRIRESSDPNDRWMYQKQIMVWERKAAEEQAAADHLYKQITSYEPAKESERASRDVPEAIEPDTVINEMTVYTYTGTEPSERAVIKEEDAATGDPAPDAPLEPFSVTDHSPYSAANPIPVDPGIPPGAFYRIQLGVFSTPVDPDTFGGISPITAETIPDRGLIRYYAGTFSRYADVERALQQVRAEGFADAFVVSWYNGTKMSADRVRKLEK